MDKYNYNVQSYFKNLCKSYYIAYEQFKRFENDKQSRGWDFWHMRVYTCQKEIRDVIEDMAFDKISIIISTKEEVFTLIWLYSNYAYKEYACDTYNTINISKEAEYAYPMYDILCKKFWDIYKKSKYCRDEYKEILKSWEERWK